MTWHQWGQSFYWPLEHRTRSSLMQRTDEGHPGRGTHRWAFQTDVTHLYREISPARAWDPASGNCISRGCPWERGGSPWTWILGAPDPAAEAGFVGPQTGLGSPSAHPRRLEGGWCCWMTHQAPLAEGGNGKVRFPRNVGSSGSGLRPASAEVHGKLRGPRWKVNCCLSSRSWAVALI